MVGVDEATAATPSDVSLLLCPHCYDVVSDVMVEQGGCIIREYAQTVVCADDSWKMVYHVLGLWLKVDSSGFLLRRRSRTGVLVLEFDGMFGDMFPGLILSTAMVLLLANYFRGP